MVEKVTLAIKLLNPKWSLKAGILNFIYVHFKVAVAPAYQT